MWAHLHLHAVLFSAVDFPAVEMVLVFRENDLLALMLN
jgi:hypothetical protein